jgi:hypothetical protein
MNNARPMPPVAKVFLALIGLATLGTTLLLIVGSFAGIVAIVRWLLSVFAICPT